MRITSMSLLSLYRPQEEVRDLLYSERPGSARPGIRIQELPSGVCLAGAVERDVASQEEMVAVLQEGTCNRATASTMMNNRSSRSHAIFTITVEQKGIETRRLTANNQAFNEEDGDDIGECSRGARDALKSLAVLAR